MKKCSCHYSLGKCKLKRVTFSHLLEWLKSKQTITSIAKQMEKWQSSYIADGDRKWYSHFEKWFRSFLKSQTQTYHIT